MLCLDLDYTVRKFQEAAGGPVTGKLSARDLDRLAAAVGAVRQDIAAREDRDAAVASQRAAEDWQSGITLFGLELGGLLPDWPRCQFTLADQDTCTTGQGEARDLYFSSKERPPVLAEPSIALRTTAIPIGARQSQIRLVGMQFRTTTRHLAQFEAKFGPAQSETFTMQNEYGARWTGSRHVWELPGQVQIDIHCGEDFGASHVCDVRAALDRPETKPQRPPSTGRAL